MADGPTNRRRPEHGDGDGKQRLDYFDNVKGVLITLVVMGHLLGLLDASDFAGVQSFRAFIYLFHMPLFIFVSGLFSRSVFKKGNFKAANVIYYLALAFVLYALLRIEAAAISGKFGSFDFFCLGKGSIPWYLVAMAWYALSVPLLSRLRPVFGVGLAIVFAAFSGFYAAGDFLTISRTLVFAPFFALGYYLTPARLQGFRSLKAFSTRKRRILVSAAAACVLVCCLLAFFVMSDSKETFIWKMSTGRNSFATMLDAANWAEKFSLWFCFGARIAWYGIVAVVGLAVLLLIPKRTVPALTRCGRHSLQVYFCHPLVYYPLNLLGAADALCAVLPPAAVVSLLGALSIALSLVLGYSNAPPRVFERLKRLCERICTTPWGAHLTA